MVRVEVVGIMSFFVLAPAIWGILMWRVPWFGRFHDELGIAVRFAVAIEWLAIMFTVCWLFLRLGWAVTAAAGDFPAAGNTELPPAEIVSQYLSLAASQPDRAVSMLSDEAAIMIFDLAAPMADHFPEFDKRLLQSGCTRSFPSIEGKSTGNASMDADAVTVEWTCPKSATEKPASTTMRFIVVEQKIVGAILADPPGYRASMPD